MSKDLTHIADYLYGAANELRFEDPDATVTYMVPGTRLNITCVCTREAVRAVADKYDSGYRARAWRTGTGRPPARPSRPVAAAFMQFVNDGETDNAREYLRLWPLELWPSALVQVVHSWDR